MAERWEESRKRHSGLAKQHKIMCIVIGVLGVVVIIVLCVLIGLSVKLGSIDTKVEQKLTPPPVPQP
jgi:flagellar basal body-associated protein FliL